MRNMRLSAKMGVGFGAVLVLTCLLGAASWLGMRGVSEKVALDSAGAKCVDAINRCAILRRDFAVQGFVKAEGEAKTAADKWIDAYGELAQQVQTMQGDSRFSESQRESLRTTLTKAQAYRQSFDRQIEARKARDDAFETWRKVGAQVTQAVQESQDKVIAPAVAEALRSQKAEDVNRWTAISTQLDRSVVQPFLLLRVCAVYLLATNAEAQWTAYQKQLATTQEGLASWAEKARGQQSLEALAKDLASYLKEYAVAGEQYHSGIVAQRSADAEMAAAAKDVLTLVDGIQADLKQQMTSTTARTGLLIGVLSTVALVFGVLAAVLITRSITRPVTRIIANMTEGAGQTADAAGQVAAASQSLAEGTSEQAAAIEETSSSLEEMSSMTKQNANNAQQANGLMDEARKRVTAGQESMSRLVSAIETIKKSADDTAKIVRTIDEIAFQTNLLALNAAVEAARAGDAGKGFAVVAEEVRNLAQRAGEAARTTGTLIEGSVRNADNGVGVAAEAATALEEIATASVKVASLVNEIATACGEQAQGIEQVTTAVSQMDQVTQQNAANAEQSAAAAEELSAQAEQLNGMVNDLRALVYGSSAGGGVAGPATAAGKAGRGAGKAPLPPADAAIHKHIIEKAKPDTTPGPAKAKRMIPLDSKEELAAF